MKRYLLYLFSIVFVLSIASSASAYSYDYTQDANPNVSIANDNVVPNANNWYQLLLPTWYDHNYVTAFTIDMYGTADNSTNTIDVWRKLGDSSASASKIVGFDVSNGTRKFILELNLMDMNLYRKYKKSDGTWTDYIDTTKNLSNISLSNFDGLSSFMIGYACHFTYDKTVIHIEQRQVPEPTTMLLLGLGLIGLAGVKRKLN